MWYGWILIQTDSYRGLAFHITEQSVRIKLRKTWKVEISKNLILSIFFAILFMYKYTGVWLNDNKDSRIRQMKKVLCGNGCKLGHRIHRLYFVQVIFIGR